MKRVVLLFLLLAVGLWSADEPSEQFSPAPRQHAPIIIHERHGSNITSSNWSGYAVTGANGSVSDVKGTWTVPAVVSCPSSNQYASFWIGIDGYDSNTVEQIGTDSDCQSGSATYYAWFEFYPHLSYTINKFPVHPGDSMSAEVSCKGGIFTVSLTNNTTGLSFSTSTKMNNARCSSAEWIAEAPSGGGIAPLADFQTINFGPGDYATIGSSSGPIGSFAAANVFEITMVNRSGVAEATPTVLTSNDSFSVSYDAAGSSQ
jgi:hypothetical protein